MDSTNLKWVTWSGYLPDNAVSIYNIAGKRNDYVCKHGIEAGFYTPRVNVAWGYYPKGGKEHRVTTFEILVNQDNLENLSWKKASNGSVPKNSVETCSGSGIFVGRNKDGLGKVQPSHGLFYLPWKTKEYSYKEYEVLTYDTDILSQEICNVKYNREQAKTLKVPPEVISTSCVHNKGCSPVAETVTLRRTLQEEKRWDSSFAVKLGVSTTMTAGVPLVASGSIQYSAEATFTLSQGTTTTESKSYSLSVNVTVPPGHSRAVSMVGHKHSAEIPYTAHVTRTYRSGKTTSGYISGIYRGVNIVDVDTVVERCTPIPNFLPCSE